MRPLSLLSLNKTNSPASSPNPRSLNRIEDAEVQVQEKEGRVPSPTPDSESEPESEAEMEAEMNPEVEERSDALSIIQEESSSQSIKHDSMPPLPTNEGIMRTSLQLASDLREGLETFLEDLNQAAVGEKQYRAVEPEASEPNLTSKPLRKQSHKRGPQENEHPKSPPLELKNSSSLIKTTLVAGYGDHHHSALVDLDNDFFDSELWKEPVFKSPVVLSPKLEHKPSSKSRRRYLNMESEENLAIFPSAGANQELPHPEMKSPRSSRETASVRRGSTSSACSNAWSSTT